MKKFLSICACVMLCLTSLMFIGCEKKPKPVAKDVAAAELSSAMAKISSSESVKMSAEFPMGTGNILFVIFEDRAYIETNTNLDGSSFNMQVWSTNKVDYVETYMYMSIAEEDEDPFIMAEKSISIEQEDITENETFDDMFGDFSMEDFVEASTLNGELSIVFSEDGKTTTLKIVDGTLVSISSGGVTLSVEYEGDYSELIPEIPEESSTLTWNIISEIVVEGVPDVLKYGQPLDLDTLTLKFYEEGYSYYEEGVVIELTQDMISQTENGYIVTCFGLTYEIPYTIPAA